MTRFPWLLALASSCCVSAARVKGNAQAQAVTGKRIARPLSHPPARGPIPHGSTSIRLLMVRHGQSCANVISDYGGLRKLVQHKSYRDPLLSDCGASRTETAKEILAAENVDFVGSSPLMRAIETAYIQFGGRTVHILPHVGEEAHGIKGAAVWAAAQLGVVEDADNTPLPEARQRQVLRQHYPEFVDSPDLLDYRWTNATDPSSWSQFEQFLAKQLLPSIVPPEHDSIFTLGIASHSLFLENSLGKNPDGNMFDIFGSVPSQRESLCWNAMPQKGSRRTKPLNNQVLELFYNFDRATRLLTLDESKGCRAVGRTDILPVGVPNNPSIMCETDFKRCIPGWRPESDRTCNTAPRVHHTQVRPGKLEHAPGVCATHHECNEGFPYVNSVEQHWAEQWRKIDASFCDEHGVPCDLSAFTDGPGSFSAGRKCATGNCKHPSFPDLQQQCQCAAATNEPLTCTSK